MKLELLGPPCQTENRTNRTETIDERQKEARIPEGLFQPQNSAPAEDKSTSGPALSNRTSFDGGNVLWLTLSNMVTASHIVAIEMRQLQPWNW